MRFAGVFFRVARSKLAGSGVGVPSGKHPQKSSRDTPDVRKAFLMMNSGTGSMCVWNVMGRVSPGLTQ